MCNVTWHMCNTDIRFNRKHVTYLNARVKTSTQAATIFGCLLVKPFIISSYTDRITKNDPLLHFIILTRYNLPEQSPVFQFQHT